MLAEGLLALAVRTQDPAPATLPRPEPREVLALSCRAHDDIARAEVDPVHQLLELPLQHLGLVVRSRNLDAGEPADVDPTVTRAVLTFLDGGDPQAPWLLPWLHRQRTRCPGLRFVHFGDLGPLEADADAFALWIAQLGFAYRPGFSDDPLRIAVEFHDRDGTHFESPPNRRFVHHGPRSVDKDHRVWLTTRLREGGSDPRTPVVTGAFGGIALRPWTVREGTAADDRRWHLDPFRFFADALATHDLPAPEPCVHFGRRAFLLHVDGDGFESQSTTRPGQLSARVFLDEVIARWRIPMTVSVIVAGLTDDLAPIAPNERMLLAREIFARPWVEAASHSVLHPLNWRRKLTARTAPRTVTWYDDKVAGYAHDMTAEVRASIEFVNRWLVPDGGRCAVMLWSGMANPEAAVLREAARLHCANLNGGVSRFDASADSVGYVSPWGKRVGDAYQVYCGAANENVFDGFFTTLPSVFRHVDTTIARTGAPRILKPANVYVHFYSAERPARLAALHGLLARWVDREDTVPITGSAYARAVTSAASDALRIVRTANGFSLGGLGDLRCVRFADPSLRIDWERSKGVLGARVLRRSLYVQLSADAATIVWERDAGAAPRPHLVQSDHALTEAVRTATGLRMRSTAWRDRVIECAGFLPGARVLVRTGDEHDRVLVADGTGHCVLRLPPGDDVIEVREP
jgi:hypothetical protein